MSHGTPDWGHARQITSFSMVDDLAELAARLDSIHVHDRRGDVLWMDNFAHDMEAWRQYSVGTGASVALSATYPKWPPYCVKLTGGSDSSRLAYILYRTGLPTLKRLGFEASIAFFTRFDQFLFFMDYYDGTDRVAGLIYLDDTDRKIYYKDTDFDSVEVADLGDLVDEQGIYHAMKLVLDFENEEYVRFILDNTEHDLSGIATYTASSVIVPQLVIHCWFYSRTGQNDYCQVDGAILTQDEP